MSDTQPSSPTGPTTGTDPTTPPTPGILDPASKDVQNLVDKNVLYPTEYHLSYIQNEKPVEIKRGGVKAEVKDFGIVDLQFPGQKLTLCGEGPTQNKVTGMDFFKEKLNSVYASAKNVEFHQKYPLPWEKDRNSKFLDSEMEILEEKVRYLAMIL